MTSRTWIVSTLICGLAQIAWSHDTDTTQAMNTPLDAALSGLTTRPELPLASLSVLAVRDGAVVYAKAFGRRSIEADLPATPDTLYRVASVSKMITAIGVMRLVEQGRVDLDADASRYLGFSLRNPSFPQQVITARMLLAHTASMRDPQDLLGFQVGTPLATALAPTTPSRYWSQDASQSPGQRYFSYANINSVVLGTLIERVSGQRFDRYIREALLAPLGIAGGFYPAADLQQADIGQLATLYRKSPDGGDNWAPAGPWVPQGPDRTGVAPMPIADIDRYVVGSNAGIFGPQGGLRISARGLGMLLRLMIGRGTVDGVTILAPETVALMSTPQWTANDQTDAPNGDTEHGMFLAWGLGLQVFTDSGGSSGAGDRVGSAAGGFKGFGHLGDAYGLLSGFLVDPVHRDGMVYLIGGLGADPAADTGRYSAFYGAEEAILRELYQRAVLRTNR